MNRRISIRSYRKPDTLYSLKSLTIPSEVSELYMGILEDTFKSNEGDRKKQIQGLKERI